MPFMGALFLIPSNCMGMTTKKVWSYTLVELSGVTQFGNIRVIIVGPKRAP
jgi:hypothetical protein